MKSSISIILAVVIVTAFTSCKKDNNSCSAGNNGNVTVVAYPTHHGKEVRPYSAWVKFNTQELPGLTASAYDAVFIADTTENHIELENLQCGSYYVYMTGFDTSISAIAVGGIPFTIAEGTVGEIDLNVPVTED